MLKLGDIRDHQILMICLGDIPSLIKKQAKLVCEQLFNSAHRFCKSQLTFTAVHALICPSWKSQRETAASETTALSKLLHTKSSISTADYSYIWIKHCVLVPLIIKQNLTKLKIFHLESIATVECSLANMADCRSGARASASSDHTTFV